MKLTLENGAELYVEHPQLTPADIIELSRAGEVLERSDHVGNQHIAALSTVTDPRISVRQILVDTIHSKDQEYGPRRLHVLGRTIPVGVGASSNRNVRHMRAGPLKGADARALSELPVEVPEEGADLSDFHKQHLKRVAAGRSAVVYLSELISNNEAVIRPMMTALHHAGLLRRVEQPDGTMVAFTSEALQQQGIFGCNDETSIQCGVLLPLVGMMALDLAVGALAGQDIIHHQAGCDMRRYTKEPDLMRLVGSVATEALQAVDHGGPLPVYRVIDTSNLTHLFASSQLPMLPGSQYDEQIRRVAGCAPLQFTDDMMDKPLYT